MKVFLRDLETRLPPGSYPTLDLQGMESFVYEILAN